LTVEKNDLITHELKARGEPEALLRPLGEWINHALQNGLAPHLLCRNMKQAKRLEELLVPYGLDLRFLETFPSLGNVEKAPTICLGELSSGFIWANEALAIITEDEIFGPKHRLPRTPRKSFTWNTVSADTVALSSWK
jgi:transcription-repair coupling factor (superfamily II helicase)